MSYGAAARIIGRLLFGSTFRTVATVGTADQLLTGGEGRSAAFNAANEHIVDPALDGLYNQVDEGLADLLYNNLFVHMVDRPTFDQYWDQIDPTAFGATFAAMKAADLALDNILGLDLVSTRTVAMAAVGFHLVRQMGLLEQAQDYLRDAGIVDLASIIPQGETPPHQDERGFSEAAARPAPPQIETEEPAREREPEPGM